MANVYATKSGVWSDITVWNTGALPTTADDVFSNNFTVSVDVSFTVLSLRSTAAALIVPGGSFAFNTAGVTGTVTAASPLVPGATNLIQITATTGTVTLSLGGDVSTRTLSNDITINHTGNCNLILTGTNFRGAPVGANNTITTINKTSTGAITINANLIGASGGNTCRVFNSTAGNTIINGNIIDVTSATAVNQTVGNITINGDVTGALAGAVSFGGTSLNVTGNVTGGTSAVAIFTSATVNTIAGNVTAGTVAAISSTSANQIQVTGTVTASANSPAISMTNANGQVYLNGNMVNNNGKMAIYAPIVWLDRTGTTSAAFFTSGGGNRTLYSADTLPNMPAEADTRLNTVYGAGNSLTGTLAMPNAADAASGVVYDNGTVGTGLFTTATLLSELNSSGDAVAVRIRNAATPDILGELMEAFKR